MTAAYFALRRWLKHQRQFCLNFFVESSAVKRPRSGFRQEWRSEKSATVSPTSYPQLESQGAPATHPGRWTWTAQCASTLGDLKTCVNCNLAISKQLEIGTSLHSWAMKTNWLIETERYSMNVVGISSTKRRGFNTVALDNARKLFLHRCCASKILRKSAALTVKNPKCNLGIISDIN